MKASSIENHSLQASVPNHEIRSVDFETILYTITSQILFVFQVAITIFVGFILLSLFLPNSASPLLILALIATLLINVLIWYFRRKLTVKNTARSLQVIIISLLMLAFLFSIAVSSPTLMLIVSAIMAVTSLPMHSIKFSFFSTSLMVILYLILMLVIPNTANVKDILLNLPSPFGELMNVGTFVIGLGVIVVFILRLVDLLWRSVAQSEQLTTQSERMRLAQIENNKALSEQLAEQQRLITIVETLEIPIIPLLEGIIVVPLVGALDSSRMETIQQRVLELVNTRRSQLVIVEMTAIPSIDTFTANQLVSLFQAVRLLGAQTVLTGIQSEIAITLTRIGVDMSEIVSYASIQSVLEAYMPR